MPVVEASSSARAVCRECGSTIDLDEPRYGREEGLSDARRMRWRHLACAAQAMPDALLRTLELGGWRAVPGTDQDELRALIDRARLRASIQAADRSDASTSMAGRSSSAMAAAAVLEPAHGARALAPEQAQAWVLADALQARGDVRGELLALELAAEHTKDPLQARELQLERRGCWRRLGPALRPSRQLRLRWIGGFLRGAEPKGRPELDALLASGAAASLERVRVDFCTQDELTRLVDGAVELDCPLRALELTNPRLRSLEPLTRLDDLQLLRLGEGVDTRVLEGLTSLRGLGLSGEAVTQLRALSPALTLELLQLRGGELRGLAALLHGQLPSLRWLSLADLDLELGLAPLADAPELEALRLTGSPLRSLGPLASLPRLRELQLVPGTLALVSELGGLTRLERLGLHGNKVGELDALVTLEACEHLSLSGARTSSLARLRKLPRLRSLFIEGGDMRRISGLDRLVRLEQLGLSKLANLDLSTLAPLERLDTLVLAPGGRRPRQLELLAELPALRRLSAPWSLLASLEQPARCLARLEVLELPGSDMPDAGVIAGLTRLRRLLLPGRDPALVEALADAVPEVAVFSELAPRDLLDLRDPFDWRTLGWLPPGGLPGLERWS